jgi:hypothetical protein
MQDYIYTGKDSDWFSSYLVADGDQPDTPTSYDISYRNSYSYISEGNVRQWNYLTSTWSYTYGYDTKQVLGDYLYTGTDSDISSKYLQQDPQLDTSYDYLYRNSYSYINKSYSKQWNYKTSSWDTTVG